MCLQDDIRRRDVFFICTIWTSKNVLSSEVLTIPTISHVQWCFLLIMHWVHVWTCICKCTVYIPGHNLNWKLIREIIFLCLRLNFYWFRCPSRSHHVRNNKHDRFLGCWSVQITNCVPAKWLWGSLVWLWLV